VIASKSISDTADLLEIPVMLLVIEIIDF
jgi:hypothetical protein